MVGAKKTVINDDFTVTADLRYLKNLSAEKKELLLATFIAAAHEVGDNILQLGSLWGTPNETVSDCNNRIVRELAITLDDYIQEAKHGDTRAFNYHYSKEGDQLELVMPIAINCPRNATVAIIADAMLEGIRANTAHRPTTIKEALQLIR